MNNPIEIVPEFDVTPLIRLIRERRVILDSDLAGVYGIQTRVLLQAVKRQTERFPVDFLLHLTPGEAASLRSQSVISKPSRGGRRYPPFAFTEHGALMAATILNSPRAVAMSLYVIRAFVRMREDLATNAAILKRLAEIDKSLLLHDTALRDIYQKLRPLLAPESIPPKPQIGFHVKEDTLPYRTKRKTRGRNPAAQPGSTSTA